MAPFTRHFSHIHGYHTKEHIMYLTTFAKIYRAATPATQGLYNRTYTNAEFLFILLFYVVHQNIGF